MRFTSSIGTMHNEIYGGMHIAKAALLFLWDILRPKTKKQNRNSVGRTWER